MPQLPLGFQEYSAGGGGGGHPNQSLQKNSVAGFHCHFIQTCQLMIVHGCHHYVVVMMI